MELYGDLFMFTSGWTFEFGNFGLLMKKVAMNSNACHSAFVTISPGQIGVRLLNCR